MAWKTVTHCQQCGHRLKPVERKVGTICNRCCATRGNIFDNQEENDDDD